MNTVQTLTLTRQVIEAYGWNQKTFGNTLDGFCLDGALRRVTVWDDARRNPDDDITTDALYQEYRRAELLITRVIERHDIALWNDGLDKETGKEQVLAMLDQAILFAQAEEQSGESVMTSAS